MPEREKITVTLSREQAEAAVYALRCETHRQDPGEYPVHSQTFPDYDPWPSDVAALADELEVLVMRADLDGEDAPSVRQDTG